MVEEQSKLLVDEVIRKSLIRAEEETFEEMENCRDEVYANVQSVSLKQPTPEEISEKSRGSIPSIFTCHHPPLISSIDDFLLGRLILKSWINNNANLDYIKKLEEHIKFCLPVEGYSTATKTLTDSSTTHHFSENVRTSCCHTDDNIHVSVRIPLNYSRLMKHKPCRRIPSNQRVQSVTREPSVQKKRTAIIEDRAKHGVGIGIMENNHVSWIYNENERRKKDGYLLLSSDIDEAVSPGARAEKKTRRTSTSKEDNVVPAYLRLMIAKIEEHQKWIKKFKEELDERERPILEEFGTKNGQLLYRLCSMRVCADDVDRELRFLLEDLSTRVILRNTKIKNGKIRFIDFENERTRYIYSRQLRIVTEMKAILVSDLDEYDDVAQKTKGRIYI